MQIRYFDEPYRFIAPFRGKRWCRALRPFYWRIANLAGLYKIEVRGRELLAKSLQDRAGVILAPNHAAVADMPLLSKVGLEVDRYLYFLASYHVFKQSRLKAFLLHRVGGYSVLREGVDRESLRESVKLLGEGDRPLVIFPEGTWRRQCERVTTFQQGAGLILRQAAKKAERPIVLHPVAIRFWHLDDPRPEFDRRLAKLERMLRWRPELGGPFVGRLLRINAALTAIKESQTFGRPQQGRLDDRIRGLMETLIAAEEERQPGRRRPLDALDRIRALRPELVRRLVEEPASREDARGRLDDLLDAELLWGQEQNYLLESPTWERFGESLQRTEEDLFDTDVPLGPMGGVAVVGPALAASEHPETRNGDDPILATAREWIQKTLVEITAEGPPKAWACPPRTMLEAPDELP
ncbi:MAG TPA: lysophospholipid acyltransferase family protein [Planctomycetia bacterium]|nr:lysophospholipid acyltransferase family protein [Planctomycetia bacterium]